VSADVGILGAGLMGLTLAHLQLRRGRRVTVYEEAESPGGLLRSACLDGVRFDRFYHCVLPGDRDLLWLLSDLGLADRVAWRRTRAGFLYRGALYSMDGIADFLRFPPLTPAQRLRLGWTIFRASRTRGWRVVDRIGVEEYLVRLGGRQVFDKVWRPLLRAKLGDAWRDTSAAFIWSSIQRLTAARATPDRAEKLGFVLGSYEVVLERLARRIAEAGGRIRTRARVERLERHGERLALVLGRERAAHDVVVATIPPAALAGLVDGIAPEMAASLRAFRFLGVRVLVLLLRRPLTGYYVLNLADPDVPVTGVIEMGNLAPEGYFGAGRSLVYLPRYAEPESPAFRGDDAAFRRECLAFLGRVAPGFSESWIVAETAFRAPAVLPVPGIGFGDRLPPARTSVPGLYLAHNVQIYPRTLHNDAVVELARAVDVGLATDWVERGS
jgi:protoporphyrinogen oxidase